ncbi:hypothetical protein [Streptomyces sp. NPDC059076]|uniref:hypothetical protein n=1 Tax=unclassified Streptomyces TaxID=2593676 RepID=UPI0036C30321
MPPCPKTLPECAADLAGVRRAAGGGTGVACAPLVDAALSRTKLAMSRYEPL